MFRQATKIGKYVVILLLYTDGTLPWQLGSTVLAVWISFKTVISCTSVDCQPWYVLDFPFRYCSCCLCTHTLDY
jgi:hypothetical protein